MYSIPRCHSYRRYMLQNIQAFSPPGSFRFATRGLLPLWRCWGGLLLAACAKVKGNLQSASNTAFSNSGGGSD